MYVIMNSDPFCNVPMNIWVCGQKIVQPQAHVPHVQIPLILVGNIHIPVISLFS